MSYESAESASPPATVGQADVEQFWRDGAICLRGVFGPHWIELLRQATDEAIAHQDQPYWPVTAQQVLSLWIPMDHVVGGPMDSEALPVIPKR